MSANDSRPGKTGGENRGKVSDRRGDHPKHGAARWLLAAPPSASLGDVARAVEKYDSPEDVEGWSG